jgi:hypothetical protein
MFYDVHLRPSAGPGGSPGGVPDAAASPVEAAASPVEPAAVPAAEAAAVERVLAKWVRVGDGLLVEAAGPELLVRLPYWTYGRSARTAAKLLHAVVADLERATGRTGFDPQLDRPAARTSWRDTAAVLHAVADYQAVEHVDSPAVDARAALITELANPRLKVRRGTS